MTFKFNRSMVHYPRNTRNQDLTQGMPVQLELGTPVLEDELLLVTHYAANESAPEVWIGVSTPERKLGFVTYRRNQSISG